MTPFPWRPGAATGVGSLPGTDIRAATRLVFDELPDLPHLPELPARGPGSDMVGRAAALLVQMPVDLQPTGWRLVPRPGLDSRRAADLLARDLDALEEAAQGYRGPLKVQVAGPWTLAAGVELTRGDRVLADAGAVRDLAASLVEGVAAHVAAVARRVPGATVVLQVDEPALPAVLAGQVPTASGFGRLRAVEPVDAVAALGPLLRCAETVVAHCCAANAPLRLLADAGARALAVDAALLPPAADETLGELVEAGVALLLGVVPALGPGVPPTVREAAAPARALWRRLGFAADDLAATIVPTPACGLAGASEGWVRNALRLVRQVGQALLEAPEAAP